MPHRTTSSVNVAQHPSAECPFDHTARVNGPSSRQAEGYRSLDEGQMVEFDVTQGPKGLQATNVRALPQQS
jgi:'Cold-shock' DNA-binding domain